MDQVSLEIERKCIDAAREVAGMCDKTLPPIIYKAFKLAYMMGYADAQKVELDRYGED